MGYNVVQQNEREQNRIKLNIEEQNKAVKNEIVRLHSRLK